jgi:phospholipid/cholesterol/gamma-HCH transport system permease protein
MQTTATTPAQLDQLSNSHTGEGITLTSSGDWTIGTLHGIIAKLDAVARTSHSVVIQWDVAAVGRVDSAGMLLFIRCYDALLAQKCEVEILGTQPEQLKIYQLLRRYPAPARSAKTYWLKRMLNPLELIGKKTLAVAQDIIAFLTFLGETTMTALATLRHPLSLRWKAIIQNIAEAGVRALPIVALTSFLIGIVIAYQGAVQLEKFGANIFIVDMIGLSVTRELAPLITAIVVAGRTGSSYTAQIGVMKITEEIDAMRTMGFDPQKFLVLPRIIALMITLPLLIFFADIIGIGAGMLISHIHLQLSYAEFIHRLQTTLAVKHMWIGILKGPFFAWLIASISCFRGFQVSKSTESIGRYTTISVVNAIFLVIACDALFSVIFTQLGI